MVNLIKDRKAQIDAAVGYANGGKIKGPGTPTSDSIQAKVKETGEPIAVSTGERIVSKDQDALLQKIAAGIGYDSLDAMLEAGTGKPVGPTIKGGMKHAYNGALLEKPREPVVLPSSMINNNFLDQAPAVKGPASGQIPQKTDIAVLQERQQKAQAAAAPAPTPAAPVAQTPVSKIDTSNIPNSAGGNHGAETRFTANEQQIAAPSGAIQGKSSVDATKLAAPDGGGYITNASGKAMFLAPQDIAAKDPNRQYDSHGNDMTRTNEMKAQLAQMQRERLQRDMGADITSQGTRIAAQQQLAQMDKTQMAQALAQRSQREDAMSGLDQQLKGQQIAQIAEDNDLFNKAADGDPLAMKKWALKHQPKPQAPIAVDGGRVKNALTGDETTSPQVIYDPNTKTFISQSAAQAKTFTKADVDAAIKAGASKDAVAKRVAELGGDPKSLGL